MKWLLLCTWSWVLLVLMGSERSMGCLNEERMALLHIKAAFNYPNGYYLPSWQDGDDDCCSWRRVKCDNITFRVTGLHLSNIHDWWSDPWIIDAPLFLPLEELQVLDLSFNRISAINGTIHLKKLKKLYLDANNLQRVPSLYKQTSAEPQNVSSNQLEGMKLEVLVLMFNNLVNDALVDIMRITSLRTLRIGACGLNVSSKLLKGLCGSRNLEVLDISDNGFWGPLPSCIGNLTSLRKLNVGGNYFSGAIPSALLSNLKSLERVDFSENAFEGSLSLAFLANASNMTGFRLSGNRNRLEVNTEEPTWFPHFN